MSEIARRDRGAGAATTSASLARAVQSPRAVHRLLLLLSITAPFAACAHPDTDPVATCGALPQDACTEADCALSPGDDGYGTCAGHAVYDCVDGAWTGTRCEVDILVADGTWQLSYAATLPAGCPAVTLPASLTVDADQPAGTQELTPSAADATFDDVSYLVGAAGPGGYGDIISPPAGRVVEAGDVLIMDTGTQQNHPDISQNTGRDFTNGAVNGFGDGSPLGACDFHGTSVAAEVHPKVGPHGANVRARKR